MGLQNAYGLKMKSKSTPFPDMKLQKKKNQDFDVFLIRRWRKFEEGGTPLCWGYELEGCFAGVI